MKYFNTKYYCVLICFVSFMAFVFISDISIAYDVRLDNCAAANIDNAVVLIKNNGGGTLYLPTCEVTYSPAKNFHVPGGVSIIGNGRTNTILRQAVFTFNKDAYGEVGTKISRLAHLAVKNNFTTAVGYNVIRQLQGMRVDHVDFEGRFSTFLNITMPSNNENAYVVIDNCNFSLYTSYGIYTVGNNTYYENNGSNACRNLLGTATGSGGVIFFEDNNFYGYADHLIDGRQGAHYVFRHNTVQYNQIYQKIPGPIEGHGPGIGYSTELGTNCMEVYGNLITMIEGYSASSAILFRSGCGVVYNNTIEYKQTGIALALESSPYPYYSNPPPSGCAGVYPCVIGQQPHDIWIWGNTFNNICKTWNPDRTCATPGNNVLVVWDSGYWIQQNRDYFLRAPTLVNDGFTWTAFTYPHPLVSGGSNPVSNPLPPPSDPPPNAPKNLHIIKP